MSGDQSDRVQQAVADGLATAVAAEGELLNGWVAVIETIDSVGQRGLWTIASSEMKHWQTLGFLEAAKMHEVRGQEQDD